MSSSLSSAQQKSALRLRFREQRLCIDAAQKTKRDVDICEQLRKLTLDTHQNIHIFLPIASDGEIDLRQYIDTLPASVKVYTTPPPHKTLPPKRSVEQYGLTDTVIFDLIIVPMLAYDPATKHRLGYGGGFYDTLLAGQPAAQKIGVCYTEFMAMLPHEPHDHPLDLIITA